MSIPLKVNGITYNYPSLTDEGWGPDASNWALAITQSVLTKAGGLFSLTADLDLGPNFGIKSVYFKSRSANIAQSGQIRLANNESISFRNSTNNADLAFSPGSSDAIPEWNGIDLVNLTTAQTLYNKTLDTPILVNPVITGLPSFSGLTISNSTFTSCEVSDSLDFNGASFDSLQSFTLADNQSSAAPIFSFALPGNENIVVEYSIKRNGIKEIGQMILTSDGSTVQIASGSLNLATTGITFNSDINSGNIRLLYTSTNTGFSGTIKYITRRWAD